FSSADPMLHNVFRYNLSVNDGIDGYGAITVWGADSSSIAASAVFHNNTAVVDGSVAPASRGPVWFNDTHLSDNTFVNNSFVALNGAALIDGTTDSNKARFVNNDYWTGNGPVKISGSVFPSIAAWAATSQQETLSGQ